MSKLFIVATPIGNLDDISPRAVAALRAADWIACEDTRRTRVLLDRYQIQTPMVSYHQHSRLAKIDWLVGQLRSGKDVALVSDAGTPGINDPGGRLVAAARATGEEIEIVPIPGPNAAVTLLSASGWPADRYLCLGYLPKKKGRQTLIRRLAGWLAQFESAVVLYESPQRLSRTLHDLSAYFDSDATDITVGRELTKQFEEIWQGNLREAIAVWGERTVKGELVLTLSVRTRG